MRPKSANRDLPPRMLRRTRVLKNGTVWEAYYYNGRNELGKRIEIPLGSDLNEAKKKWAELERHEVPADVNLMRFIFDRYERDIIPTKAPRTQKDNLSYLTWLRKVFDSAPMILFRRSLLRNTEISEDRLHPSEQIGRFHYSHMFGT